MSRGNYHLTIDTTPEAVTEDDVTLTEGQGNNTNTHTHIIMSSGLFLDLSKHCFVLFFFFF